MRSKKEIKAKIAELKQTKHNAQIAHELAMMYIIQSHIDLLKWCLD